MTDLWQVDAQAGRRDCAPGATALLTLGSRFDWAAKSRVTEDSMGRLTGAILLTSRATPLGVLAIMDVCGSTEVVRDLIRWAVGLSRAAGAAAAQLFVGTGHGEGLLAGALKRALEVELDLRIATVARRQFEPCRQCSAGAAI